MVNPKEFRNLNANATTILSAEYCILGSVIINNAGTTGNTLTLYNSNGGSTNPIAVIDTVELNGRQLDYNIACPIGLTAVMATGTAADVTITLEGSN